MNEYNNVLALLDKQDVEALLHHYLRLIRGNVEEEITNDAVKRAAKCIDWLEELEARDKTAKQRAEEAEREYENSAD